MGFLQFNNVQRRPELKYLEIRIGTVSIADVLSVLHCVNTKLSCDMLPRHRQGMMKNSWCSLNFCTSS